MKEHLKKNKKNYIFYFILILLLSTRLFWSIVTVDGHSMDPNLYDGERVVVVKHTKLDRFDVVVAKEDGKFIIKRIIGLPGDELLFDNDTLYINGKEVKETYLNEYLNDFDNGNIAKNYSYNMMYENYVNEMDSFTLSKDGDSNFKVKVPKGKYFLLGDNRPVSKDSRIVGSFSKEEIYGEMKFELKLKK